MKDIKKRRVGIVFGTRPEAIKIAPIVLQFNSNESAFDFDVINSRQQPDLAEETLNYFGLKSSELFENNLKDVFLNSSLSRIINGLHNSHLKKPFNLMLAQGDTTTVLAVAIFCFNARIPFFHIEAGLRTHDIESPFPEEFNRKIAAIAASHNFAPTEIAKQNLENEGVKSSDISVVGNTSMDSLRIELNKPFNPKNSNLPSEITDGNFILVTLHRRENVEHAIKSVILAINKVLNFDKNLHILLPIHTNPKVVDAIIGNIKIDDRVHIVAPLNYSDLVRALQRCRIVITDSGGIQEEAVALGVPMIVTRKSTERPEIFGAANVEVLAGKTENIFKKICELLKENEFMFRGSIVDNRFGDGFASERIHTYVKNYQLKNISQ